MSVHGIEIAQVTVWQSIELDLLTLLQHTALEGLQLFYLLEESQCKALSCKALAFMPPTFFEKPASPEDLTQ
ncbi:MAG: hypothetical protein EZS28_005361 [Streblomastix strix]|uniref:Uncharacterized protein n=1 Tax=Streblomastix strix TaxID=222440 RepID=A0A5J4WW98_9EUKA|nr:MAG: hypothetical protein EZS28_005361 [Streblomastix strix]